MKVTYTSKTGGEKVTTQFVYEKTAVHMLQQENEQRQKKCLILKLQKHTHIRGQCR